METCKDVEDKGTHKTKPVTVIEVFICDGVPFHTLGIPEGVAVIVWDCKALDRPERTLKHTFTSEYPTSPVKPITPKKDLKNGRKES